MFHSPVPFVSSLWRLIDPCRAGFLPRFGVLMLTGLMFQADCAGAVESGRDQRMAWWREARFGLFIHWGVYSVPAGMHRGKPVEGYGEWIMLRGKIPCDEYREFAKQFDPVEYDPASWVRAAKEAGMKYIVVTTKHHDGFAMFDTKVNDWSIVRATPYAKDALRGLVEVCRRENMPLGFYYSQAQDWMNGGSATGGLWDPKQGRDMDAYVDKVAIPQVRELLTSYGPDFPALLWWDTPVGMDEAKAKRLERVTRELRPGLITNNRLYAGQSGDIMTPEQFVPEDGYHGRDWETCMTMNGTWGFRSDDHQWKSSGEMIRNLINAVSRGGNYLLNVGPDALGRIPQESLDRLRDVGKWMAINGGSIHGARGVSLDRRVDWGRCTAKAETLYAHIYEWPPGGELDLPIAGTAVKAWLLAKPGESLAFERTGDALRVRLPEEAPDKVASVVAVQFKETIPPPSLPVVHAGAGSVLRLEAEKCRVVDFVQPDRAPAVVMGGVEEITLTYWKSADVGALWRVRFDHPGTYRVRLHHSVAPESAGSPFELRIGEQLMTAEVPSTGSWTDYGFHEVGLIEVLKPGVFEVSIKPRALAEPTGFMNLKSIELIPAKPE